MFDRRLWRRAVRLLSWLGVVAAIAFWSRQASAYPWMIRHQYQGCVPCHADPSGAGLLTDYGRAMAENILRTRYGSKAPDEPPVYARFLFGVPTPDWLLLGGSVRTGILALKTLANVGGFQTRLLFMEADLKAQMTFGRFRAYGSLGYMHDGAALAQITHRAEDNLVSREHWFGVDLGEDKQFLLRAGRIDIPFGIRNDEHELLVRSTQVTGTNINESQQHGIAFSYNGTVVRGEIMALLGNYQLNPDAYRQRGYAGFVEVSIAPWAAAGLSSMVTYARVDYNAPTPHTIRQVHGLFTRFSPKEPLVLMAEVDALIITSDVLPHGGGGTSPGMVGLLQADIEPTQGLHIVLSGEALVQNNAPVSMISGLSRTFGGWGGLLWFFAPHADARFDFVATSTDGTTSIYFLPQLHLFL